MGAADLNVSDADFDRLDAYLLSEQSPPECMLLSDLDGFTQLSLSKMLSVRRQGVPEALQSLEEKGAISAKPGQITVLDRATLEGVVGDSYGVPEPSTPAFLAGRCGPSSPLPWNAALKASSSPVGVAR